MTAITDEEKIKILDALGAKVYVTGDVMTIRFKNGMKEDWLAVSPMMLELDAWRQWEAFELHGRTWVKCEGGIA